MMILVLPLFLLMLKVKICQGLVGFFSNETEEEELPLCRTERGVRLSLEDYRKDTCARCYFYLPSYAFRDEDSKLRYDEVTGLLVDTATNASYDFDPEDGSHPAYTTFRSSLFARKWLACCRAALDCCSKMIVESLTRNYTDDLQCPRTWDGWQCWEETHGGETARALCPEHIYFMSEPPPCPRYAEKRCLANGTWFVNEWDSEWTDYFGCSRLEGMRRLVYFHIVTYAISILFLLPALLIFTIYKQLQVYRVTMHKHLFAALLLNAFLSILFKAFAVLEELEIPFGDRITPIEENTMGCRLLYVLTVYSRMTTYMWMFCEGFYLHKLISASFAEQKSLALFYVIGWAFPVFPVATFAFLRWRFADAECWAVPVYPYEWITNSLNLMSLLLNLLFLCNIIQVLVTKLRKTHRNEPRQFRKAVKATLVLVPLFGLHFFFVIYRPESAECSTLEGYTFLSYAMDGLQGLLVSLIFCYLNGEIQSLLRRSLQRLQLQRSLTSSSEWRRSTWSETRQRTVNIREHHRGAVSNLMGRSFFTMRKHKSSSVQSSDHSSEKSHVSTPQRNYSVSIGDVSDILWMDHRERKLVRENPQPLASENMETILS